MASPKTRGTYPTPASGSWEMRSGQAPAAPRVTTWPSSDPDSAFAKEGSLRHNQRVGSFPDPRSLASHELTTPLKDLVGRENDVSGRRRVLHARIDALRRELVDRMREGGQDVIFGADIEGPDWTGVREPRDPRPQLGSDGVALREPDRLRRRGGAAGTELAERRGRGCLTVLTDPSSPQLTRDCIAGSMSWVWQCGHDRGRLSIHGARC
jgi:hypothetical protein